MMGLNEREDYAMPAVARILAQSCITSIQDPMSVARTLEMYDWLEQSGAMSFRVRAHFYGQPHASVYSNDPDVMARIPEHVAHFSELREKYRASEFIQANGVKFFMDGAFEVTRETADKLDVTRTIAHATLVHPDDAQRLGKLGV